MAGTSKCRSSVRSVIQMDASESTIVSKTFEDEYNMQAGRAVRNKAVELLRLAEQCGRAT